MAFENACALDQICIFCCLNKSPMMSFVNLPEFQTLVISVNYKPFIEGVFTYCCVC